MSVERFTTLFLRGLSNGYEEMWISEQPYLFFTYATVYTPWLGRQVAKMMGPQRVKALKSGENIFDIKVSLPSPFLLPSLSGPYRNLPLNDEPRLASPRQGTVRESLRRVAE
jgi:hypothetical protein